MTPARSPLLGVVGVLAALLPLGLSARPDHRGTQTPAQNAAAPTSRQEDLAAGRQTVAVYAAVRAANGRLVTDLTKDDFTLTDNGAAVTVNVFSTDPLPVTAVFLIDMSDAAVAAYPRIQQSAARFVHALAPGDRLRLGTFGQEIALSPLLTGDASRLDRVLDEELWPGGPAPVWLAAREAMASLDDERGRRAIVVWSFGKTSSSVNPNCPQSETGRGEKPPPCVTPLQVGEDAASGGFLFYAVGLDGAKLDADLAKLTDDTGGASFDIHAAGDLDAAFGAVLDDLRHQYILGFTPAAADGKVHRLDVTVGRPGVTVHARRSFVARPR